MSAKPRDISKAIEAKKAQAAANKSSIAAAISRMTKEGLPMTVLGVAREAGVSPDTVRRSGDLYQEVKRLRGQPRPGQSRTARPAPDQVVLRARLVAAQGEIAELRTELAAARRGLHQVLGTTGTVLDAAEVEQMRRDNADLTVRLMDLQSQVDAARDENQNLTGELLAANELNRQYMRKLTEAEARNVDLERSAVAERLATRQ